MALVKLTKRAIDALPPADPETERFGRKYYDSELSGFGLRVYPSGRRMFFVEYGPRGKRRRMTIGRYGVLTPPEARELARKHLADVVRGGDPLADRNAAKAMPTVGEWIDDYLSEVKRRKKHPRVDVRHLGWCKARWGDRPLDSLTVAEFRRAMADRSEGHPIRGNRWLASIRACLNAAWRADLIPSNPAARIRPNRENPPRSRVLTDPELRRVVRAIDEQRNPFVRLAFLLLVTTGARCSEVLRARWEDVDLTGRTWRIPSPKSGRPQVVPLSGEALELLRTAPRMEGSPWVIPGRGPAAHRVDLDRPWKEIRQRAKVPDVRIHDIRRTFGLAVARAAGLHVASKLLRHSTVTVTEQVYAPLGLDDLRAGLDAVERTRGKVIPMRLRKVGGGEE